MGPMGGPHGGPGPHHEQMSERFKNDYDYGVSQFDFSDLSPEQQKEQVATMIPIMMIFACLWSIFCITFFQSLYMYAIVKTIKTQTLLENQFMGPEIVYQHARPQPIMAQAYAQPEAAISFISVPTVQ